MTEPREVKPIGEPRMTADQINGICAVLQTAKMGVDDVAFLVSNHFKIEAELIVDLGTLQIALNVVVEKVRTMSKLADPLPGDKVSA